MEEKNKKKTEIKISGMTCANCAKTIEKSISNLKGVSKAQVNLGTEIATVEYDKNKVKINNLNKAVTDAGYDVINEKTVVKIGGMTCAMCVKTNEEALKKLEGVISAHVNLSAEKAYITYNPNLTTIADITGTFVAIDGYGYYNEGVNPTKPTNNILSDVSYRKVDRNGFILFPYVNNGTITSIDIYSSSGNINATETMITSTQSTDVVQYICVDNSQATTDEYITITTQPAGDVYTYEIVDECRFNPKQIIFKNKYGVYEVVTLFKKSNTALSIDSDMFVNNYISSGTYDTTKHQFQKLNIQGKSKITLNSGYIKETENELYQQLLLSDVVYFYESDALVPVNLTTSDIEYKTRVNDKLIQYTLEFEYAYNIIQNV